MRWACIIVFVEPEELPNADADGLTGPDAVLQVIQVTRYGIAIGVVFLGAAPAPTDIPAVDATSAFRTDVDSAISEHPFDVRNPSRGVVLKEVYIGLGDGLAILNVRMVMTHNAGKGVARAYRLGHRRGAATFNREIALLLQHQLPIVGHCRPPALVVMRSLPGPFALHSSRSWSTAAVLNRGRRAS